MRRHQWLTDGFFPVVANEEDELGQEGGEHGESAREQQHLK